MYVFCISFCLWLISQCPHCVKQGVLSLAFLSMHQGALGIAFLLMHRDVGTCLSCACTAIVHQGSYVVFFFTYILEFDFVCDVVQVLLTLL